MNSENPTPNQPDETSNTGTEIQGAEAINTPAGQPQANNEFQEVRTELTGYERSTLRLTWVIVGINLLTCFFVGLQWHEMKSGSVDTHTLAQAAKDQAGKMSDVSSAADKIRQSAQDMVAQDQRIADNAGKSLDASNKQSRATLDATIQDFQRDQRAWVGLGQYAIQHFDSKEPFRLAIPFVNSGKTPAISTEEATVYDISDRVLLGPPDGYEYKFEKGSAIPPPGVVC